MSNYEITEQDIEGTFKYLQIFHPEKASKEYALAMLEYLKAGYHELSKVDPEGLDKLYLAFEESKNS
jgi:hypothetical protein